MRVLLIVPGAIGDFILLVPAIAWLKQKLAPAWLEIWAERVNLELAAMPGLADRAQALADTGIERWPTPEAVFERLDQFDQVISWRGANYPEWAAPFQQRHPGIHFLPAFSEASDLHVMDFRRQQVQALSGSGAQFPPFPSIQLTIEAISYAEEFLCQELDLHKPIVMIHPGASGPRKRWLAFYFAEVIQRLSELSCSLLMCEGPLDGAASREVGEALASHGNPAEPRRVSIESLMRLAAVIARCLLYIGNDSGITHLAAATGIPTLAIFTGTDPRLWSPRGRCVQTLVQPSVSEVLAQAQEFLQ